MVTEINKFQSQDGAGLKKSLLSFVSSVYSSPSTPGKIAPPPAFLKEGGKGGPQTQAPVEFNPDIYYSDKPFIDF